MENKTDQVVQIPVKVDANMVARLQKELIVNASLMRQELIQKLLGEGGRDIDFECKYPFTIAPGDYSLLYDRMGIAQRVVHVIPDESWSTEPDIYETEDEETITAFETGLDLLEKEFHLNSFMNRVDGLSGIGRFGILLIGIDDGKQMSEAADMKKGGNKAANRKLLYLRVFDESVVTVATVDNDIASPRFGQPLTYAIQFTQSNETISKTVHYSRIVHVADNRRMSEIYGTPRMQPVYNFLIDLKKILGGSAEMFWKGGFPGYAFEVDPECDGAEMDTTSVREEFQRFSDSLQRYFALTGVTVKSLAPQVADPTGHIEAQLTAIAITLNIPKRLLIGSEQAQLASGQDSKTWLRRLSSRQNKYLSPMLIRPIIDRFIELGILPAPKEYTIEWPDLLSLSGQEQAAIAVQQTAAAAQYVAGSVFQIMSPKDFWIKIVGFNEKEAEAIIQGAADFVADEENGMNEPHTHPAPGTEEAGTPQEEKETEPQPKE